MFMMLAAVVCASMMTSCQVMFNNDSEVVVEVKNAQGISQSNQTVYMYKATQSMAELKDYHNAATTAKAHEVTDGNGICRFVIDKGTFVAEDRIAYIFQTFDADGNVNSRKAHTVYANGVSNLSLYFGTIANF